MNEQPKTPDEAQAGQPLAAAHGSATASFGRELEQLINKYSRENGSNTPDFILTEYIMGCLLAFDQAIESRDRWYGHGSKVASVLSGAESPNALIQPHEGRAEGG